MRVPLSWLKDFTPLEVDVFDEAAVRALATSLDALGLVVESIETVGGGQLPGRPAADGTNAEQNGPH